MNISTASTWRQAIVGGTIAGSVASVVSTAALAALSAAETGRPFAAVNAASHWIWGRQAFRQDALTFRYSGTGYVIHHVASIAWGIMTARLFPHGHRTKATTVIRDAILTSIAASIGDYVVVPKRITPGVDKRLSSLAVGVFYVAFAAGLAAGMMLVQKQQSCLTDAKPS